MCSAEPMQAHTAWLQSTCSRPVLSKSLRVLSAHTANMCTPVTSGLLKSYMSNSPWSNKAWASGELVWILHMAAAHTIIGSDAYGGQTSATMFWCAGLTCCLVCLLVLQTLGYVCRPQMLADFKGSQDAAGCTTAWSAGVSQTLGRVSTVTQYMYCNFFTDDAGISVHCALTCW
jgi:hypothetical protein